MSFSVACSCEGPKKERMKNWRVVDYKCNYSAFNGYHFTLSEYSSVTCIKCPGFWRTKAKYVEDLQGANYA